MTLISFSPNTLIESSKVNANFAGLADGTLIEKEDWITPTMQNSWVAYGGTYDGAMYIKDGNGIVHLQGLLKDGSSASAIMFTLPAGYRPVTRLIFNVYASTGSCRLDVKENGEVNANTGGSTSWTSISGISFRGDQ